MDQHQDGHDAPARGDYLDRLLQVLESVAKARRPLTLSEICRELSLPMTTVHRLLVALWKTGVLQRDNRRRYLLGGRLVALITEPDDSGNDAS
ncbi:helix-turn-helix domain-containing protein [Actinosynnema sp. CS-041913]|uniref:helix-turn-helix domain-containing protein n=1 Tax=Actinosynnema sp. CS-041913 TaxID=3239917 RepID=UPI003D8AD0AE